MKYVDGRLVLAGDIVRIDGRYRGIVIAAIDDRSYLPGGEDWEYLGSGAMIDTDFGGLVHYQQDDEELVLVHRAYK
ncbi:MAG TPA: hypothetical protein VM621_02480 [Luteibacter sp.]|uniref:hypothetical protein n=1 Tax=Luteibacter sp. TaxID=1886636 RepID=UPI002BFA61D0|nr:hypothetical protein [Luteibacter sp.]HVI53903.1 hypothetical protein [Luteibacter sp.]